ncbi:MAG: O-antigen ligase family protein [Candidatus Doudnabacteria bacterium]|nr:O-antigen ligase family protein [Candidatus Doudnabacteria bacterium]
MILAALAILFLLVSLYNLRLSYGIILFLLPVYLLRFKILNIPTTALEVMLGVFLFSVLIRHFNKQSWLKIRDLGKINWAIIGFAFAAGISALFSVEIARALGQMKAFFIEPILFFYAGILVFNSKKQFELPLKFLFGSASIISLFGLIQYWTHLFLPLRFWGYGLETKRITSVFEYPNALALYIAPVFIFFIACLIKRYYFINRYWFALGLFLMSVASVLTYSRGAWLAIIAGITVIFLHESGFAFKKKFIIPVLLVVLISPLLVSRFKSTFHDGSSSERLELYKTAVDKIIEQPLLGNGLYGFRETLENSKDYKGEILNYPHNVVLNFWVETGLLGLLSFAAIIYFSLRRYKAEPHILSFAAAMFLLAMIVHGMVDAPYFKNDLSVLFWSMISIFYIRD